MISFCAKFLLVIFVMSISIIHTQDEIEEYKAATEFNQRMFEKIRAGVCSNIINIKQMEKELAELEQKMKVVTESTKITELSSEKSSLIEQLNKLKKANDFVFMVYPDLKKEQEKNADDVK